MTQRPLALPTATILFQASEGTRDMLAQAIGALDNTLEFVDLYDPIMDGIAEMFFTGGLVDNPVDIKPDDAMPVPSESHPRVWDWMFTFIQVLREAYGPDALAKLALHRLKHSPLTQDRLLFLNVQLVSEVTAISAAYGKDNVLIIKSGTMTGVLFSAKSIQLATSDPVEQIAQLRAEIGEDQP